jgi:hypothetical protein
MQEGIQEGGAPPLFLDTINWVIFLLESFSIVLVMYPLFCIFLLSFAPICLLIKEYKENLWRIVPTRPKISFRLSFFDNDMWPFLPEFSQYSLILFYCCLNVAFSYNFYVNLMYSSIHLVSLSLLFFFSLYFPPASAPPYTRLRLFYCARCSECTMEGSEFPWCAVEVDSAGRLVDGRWGKCDISTCPTAPAHTHTPRSVSLTFPGLTGNVFQCNAL